MIIFFGTGGTTGKAIQTEYTCPACGKPHSIFMVPRQKYFHIFWIPIFRVGKSFTPICGSCKSIFANGQNLPLTREIREQYKAPLWTNLGLLIIGAFFLFVVFMIIWAKLSH